MEGGLNIDKNADQNDKNINIQSELLNFVGEWNML